MGSDRVCAVKRRADKVSGADKVREPISGTLMPESRFRFPTPLYPLTPLYPRRTGVRTAEGCPRRHDAIVPGPWPVASQSLRLRSVDCFVGPRPAGRADFVPGPRHGSYPT